MESSVSPCVNNGDIKRAPSPAKVRPPMPFAIGRALDGLTLVGQLWW